MAIYFRWNIKLFFFQLARNYVLLYWFNASLIPNLNSETTERWKLKKLYQMRGNIV